jgi:GPI-anchor transamidase subunit U
VHCFHLCDKCVLVSKLLPAWIMGLLSINIWCHVRHLVLPSNNSLLLPDLTPNVGLWWYFFIEIFDSFRSFFLVVFQLHLLIYVAPLCIRLSRYPLSIITTLLGLISIFKSYPSVSDLSLYLSLLSLQVKVTSSTPEVVELTIGMRYAFLAFSVLSYAALLGPAFLHLWIYAGSGNANFFYAITLVYSLAQIILVGDALYAMVKLDWEENEGKDMILAGKKVVQI